MAKLGSSSCCCCRAPLLQGMVLLLALLLLASIQAGPVMASVEGFIDDVFHQAWDHGGEKVADYAMEKLPTEFAKRNPRLKDAAYGWKAGYKIDKIYKQNNPGGASGTPYPVIVDTIAVPGLFSGLKLATADITATPVAYPVFCAPAAATVVRSISLLGGGSGVLGPLRGTVQYCPAVPGSGGPAPVVLGLGRGGDLAKSFPTLTFSYYVVASQGGRGNIAFVWFPQPAAAGTGTTGGARASTTLVPRYPNDGRYYVKMTGIRVGHEELDVPTTLAYLSTTQPFTNLESGLYDSLTAAVRRQMNVLNRAAPPSLNTSGDKLCYAAAAASGQLWLPRVAIHLDSKQTMELGGATATDTVWYQESSMFCLGIQRAAMGESVLGSVIQSGRTMTMDLTAAGGWGSTLSF